MKIETFQYFQYSYHEKMLKPSICPALVYMDTKLLKTEKNTFQY